MAIHVLTEINHYLRVNVKYLIYSLIFMLSVFAETGGENLVNNGDIESNGSWKYVDARRQDDPESAQPDNKFIQLNYSRKFVYKDGKKVHDKSGSRDKRWTEASQRLHLKPNSSYTITFKARGSFGGASNSKNNKSNKGKNKKNNKGRNIRGASGGRVGLVKRSDATSGSVTLIAAKVSDEASSNGWTVYKGTFKTGRIVEKERLIFYSNSNGAFQIDDVVVIKN